MASSSIIHEFGHFYRISDPFLSKALRLKLSDSSNWAKSGEIAYQILTNKHEHTTLPIVFTRHSGKKPADFLWTAMVHLLCISSRLREILEKNQLSGWTTYPVRLALGPNDYEFWGFSVTGPEMQYTFQNSQIIEKPISGRPGHFRTMYRGLFFDREEWNGSDFFLVSNFIVVTQRVYELFQKSTVSNVSLTPLPEVEISSLVAEISMQGTK